jgi:4-hydroxy-tetrahydrodipicolinate synthase
LLVAPPYYMHPSISQTLDHYRRLADAVTIPIVVYYNFGGTNIDLRTEHLVQLFEENVIGGVKLSSVYPDRICELLQATDGKLVVYAGIDTVAFEGLCHGAHGWISALPSIVPRKAVEMYQTIAVKGDLIAARQQWRLLAPLMRLVFREHLGAGNDPNWLSIMKATLNMIGPSVGDPLLPIQPLDPETKKTIAGMVRALGYQVHD